MTPWDFVRAISTSKVDLFAELTEKEGSRFYKAFIVNKALSFELDCIFHVNEINRRTWIPNKQQFHFLLHTVRRKQRPLKWIKGSKNEYIKVIQETYGYNYQKAEQALEVLSGPQLEYLQDQLQTGGPNNKKLE